MSFQIVQVRWYAFDIEHYEVRRFFYYGSLQSDHLARLKGFGMVQNLSRTISNLTEFTTDFFLHFGECSFIVLGQEIIVTIDSLSMEYASQPLINAWQHANSMLFLARVQQNSLYAQSRHLDHPIGSNGSSEVA